jgi:hypothetical protein
MAVSLPEAERTDIPESFVTPNYSIRPLGEIFSHCNSNRARSSVPPPLEGSHRADIRRSHSPKEYICVTFALHADSTKAQPHSLLQ